MAELYGRICFVDYETKMFFLPLYYLTFPILLFPMRWDGEGGGEGEEVIITRRRYGKLTLLPSWATVQRLIH